MNDNKDFWKIAAIVAVCYFGYLFYQKQKDAPKPDPEKPTTESVSKVLDKAYKMDRASKLDVLKQLSAAKEKTDEEKLKLFNEQSEKKRLQDFRPYVEIVADALVNGTVDELVKRMEAGR